METYIVVILAFSCGVVVATIGAILLITPLFKR